jgi:hypothetical protein
MLLVAVLALLSSSNMCDGPFLFDDSVAILGNPDVDPEYEQCDHPELSIV